MSAWYRSGTIAVAGKTVTGTGTNWTDNKAGIGEGQALLIPGAGTVKVYEIARVDSATQLTLTDDAGTVVAGQAYAIMSFYVNSVPDFSRRLAAQLSYYQSQMDGWQEIMTGTGTITLEAPDGTQVTLSSFKKLTNDMAAKADKVGGAVPVAQGGTGATTSAGALANLGAVATNDSRLGTVNGKSGGVISSGIAIKSPGPATTPPTNTETSSSTIETGFSSGVYATVRALFHSLVIQGSGSSAVIAVQTAVNGPYTRYAFNQSGVATAPVSWAPTSDIRIKNMDGPITEPLAKMRMIRGQTWSLKDGGHFGIGFTAQDVQGAFPKAVREMGDKTLPDGSVVNGVLAPDTYGVASALHQEAILSLMDIIKSALGVIAEASSDTDTRDTLRAIAALIPEAETEQKDSAVENQ